MQQILVYSDSLSWGLIPFTRKRLPFDQRWPGVFENTLNANQQDIRIIENCLNGRRTAWSDPYKEGRDGSQGLAQIIEINSPLKLVILMLGTNDFQRMHNNTAFLSAQGIVKLVKIIRQAPIEPDMPVPEILIVAPPEIRMAKGIMVDKFSGAEKRSAGLSTELEKVAKDFSTCFFNSASVTDASTVDGIHLDQDQHRLLGEALAHFVIQSKILQNN